MNDPQKVDPTLVVGVLFGAYLVYALHEFLAIALMCGGALYAYQVYTQYNRK